jgi:CxxC-x17-CxxC domain-containing protein
MTAEGRKMYDVRAYDLSCAQCGKPIEELPFQPLTSSRPIYCRECNQNRKPEKRKKSHRRRRR